MVSQRRILIETAAIVAVAAALTGCETSPGNEKFIPPPESARAALAAVLDQWQRGDPAGEIRVDSPPLVAHPVDSHRKSGQRLASYEIAGEVSGVGPRTYSVKLKLEEPAEQVNLRYIVVGVDPLWVFRQEDYEMLEHWDHPMPAVEVQREPDEAGPDAEAESAPAAEDQAEEEAEAEAAP